MNGLLDAIRSIQSSDSQFSPFGSSRLISLDRVGASSAPPRALPSHRTTTHASAAASPPHLSKKIIDAAIVEDSTHRYRQSGGILALSNDMKYIAVGDSAQQRLAIIDSHSLMSIQTRIPIDWHFNGNLRREQLDSGAPNVISMLQWVGLSKIIVSSSCGQTVLVPTGLCEVDDETILDDDEIDDEDEEPQRTILVGSHLLHVHGRCINTQMPVPRKHLCLIAGVSHTHTWAHLSDASTGDGVMEKNAILLTKASVTFVQVLPSSDVNMVTIAAVGMTVVHIFLISKELSHDWASVKVAKCVKTMLLGPGLVPIGCFTPLSSAEQVLRCFFLEKRRHEVGMQTTPIPQHHHQRGLVLSVDDKCVTPLPEVHCDDNDETYDDESLVHKVGPLNSIVGGSGDVLSTGSLLLLQQFGAQGQHSRVPAAQEKHNKVMLTVVDWNLASPPLFSSLEDFSLLSRCTAHSMRLQQVASNTPQDALTGVLWDSTVTPSRLYCVGFRNQTLTCQELELPHELGAELRAAPAVCVGLIAMESSVDKETSVTLGLSIGTVVSTDVEEKNCSKNTAVKNNFAACCDVNLILCKAAESTETERAATTIEEHNLSSLESTIRRVVREENDALVKRLEAIWEAKNRQLIQQLAQLIPRAE